MYAPEVDGPPKLKVANLAREQELPAVCRPLLYARPERVRESMSSWRAHCKVRLVSAEAPYDLALVLGILSGQERFDRVDHVRNAVRLHARVQCLRNVSATRNSQGNAGTGISIPSSIDMMLVVSAAPFAVA